MYGTTGQTTKQIRSIPKQQQWMPKWRFVVMTVPMNTSSTIETHQNKPWTELLATNYLDQIRLIDLILSVLTFFTTLSGISDLWQQLLVRALFLQLNGIDITSRLRLD
jgi:hypothetical protein